MNSKLLILWFGIIYYTKIASSSEEIRYAAILFRHGDRTPVDPYPTDPYNDPSLWPVAFGELTNEGKKQHYLLGQWLRTRYSNLISTKFDPTEIYVRSTDVDRTLMSAMANLAGMYPPVADSVWNPNLDWQPIPVHSEEKNEDELLYMEKQCNNYEIEKKRLKNSDSYKKHLQKYANLMKFLTLHTGRNIEDFGDIMNIFSNLQIEKLYNFTLPKWTADVFPKQMVEPAAYSFTTDTATPLMARLKVGPLLKQIVRNMQKMMHEHNSKIPYHNVKYDDLDGIPPLKMNVYSAHDLTVASVLHSLGMYDGVMPKYTATVLFELVYDNSTLTHYVKIFYRNSIEIVEPVNLIIPKCGPRCPLELFVKIYDPIIPNDWDEECKEKFPVRLFLTGTISAVIYAVAFICYYQPYCAFSGIGGTASHYSTVRAKRYTINLDGV